MNNVRDEPALSARALLLVLRAYQGLRAGRAFPLPLCAFLLGLCRGGRRTARLMAGKLAGPEAC